MTTLDSKTDEIQIASGLKPRRSRFSLQRIASESWAIVGVVVAWQLGVRVGDVPAIVAPSPGAVVSDIVENFGLYWAELKYTLGVAALGLVIGTAIAGALVVASWMSAFMRGALLPGTMIVQTVPIVAMIPVLARLLGYDIKTVVAIAALITFFPTFVLLRAGMDRPPPGTQDLFRVLGARRFVTLGRLAAPSAIPNLLVALKLASANCILATLVAEFLMGTRGLGRLVADAATTAQTETAWAAALIATVISVAAFTGASVLERLGKERWT